MNLARLKTISDHLIQHVPLDKKRELYGKIETSADYATVLIGERGVGKTTLLLQYLHESDLSAFYLTADSQLISDLFEIVYELYFTYGIRLLVIDEIHKGHDRVVTLKNCIDQFPALHLIVSGSSSLDIYTGTAPLARRTRLVHLFPLTFREYMSRYHDISLPQISLDELLHKHRQIGFEYGHTISLEMFQTYMKQGMYPFAERDAVVYQEQLRRNLSKVLLEDLPTFLNLQTESLHKIEKMFWFISQTSPSDLSYAGLSKKLGFAKERLESVLRFLDQVGVVHLVLRSNKISDVVRKEYKLFLGNPNIYHAYTDHASVGTIRESYVVSMLRRALGYELPRTEIMLPRYGDISFEHQERWWRVEVGGSSKSTKKYTSSGVDAIIKDIHSSDDASIIPLWMCGLVG